jgi:MFS family permease
VTTDAATDATTPPVTGVRPGPLSSRRYWFLWSSAAISMTGDGVAMAAFPLLAQRVIGASAFMVSAIYAAGRLPAVLAVHAGAIVDRSDRRRLIAVVEVARAVLLLVFAVYVAAGDRPLIGVMAVTVFIIGTGEVVSKSVAEVTLPELVHDDRLATANGWLLSVQFAAEQMAGPALGGFLFAIAVALPFVVDGCSFAAAAILLPLAIPRRVAGPPSVSVEHPTARIRDDVRDGFSYFRRDHLLRMLSSVVLTFAFCQAMMLATLVVFATERLHLGARGYGVLIGVTSFGNVLGSLIAGRVGSRWHTDVVLIVAGVTIAVAYAVSGLTDRVVVVGIGMFLEAVFVAIGNVSSVTLRQRIIPPQLRGRAMGTFRFLILGSIPVGSLLGGLLAQTVRSQTPILMAGGLQLLAISVLGPRLRRVFSSDPRLAVAT